MQKELFKHEIKKDRERLFEFGKIDLRPYLDDLKQELEGGTAPASSVAQPAYPSQNQEQLTQKKPREQVLDFGFNEDGSKAKTKIRVSQMRSKTTTEKGRAKSKASDKPSQVEERFADLVEDGADLSLKGGPPVQPADDLSGKTKSKVKPKPSVGTKSGPGTQVRMRRDKKSGSKNKAVAAGVALLLGLGYFFSGDDASREIASKDVKESVEMPTQESPEVQEKQGKFRLANFDKFRQKVFVNGVEMETDIIGMVSAPLGEELTVRVQQPGRRHFIKNIVLSEDKDIVVEVPQMPPASYGYLETQRNCIRGKIFFEIFGEKRVEELPIGDRHRIAFPVSRSGNGSSHEVYYQKVGEDIQRKLTLNFRDGRTTDLCEYLN